MNPKRSAEPLITNMPCFYVVSSGPYDEGGLDTGNSLSEVNVCRPDI